MFQFISGAGLSSAAFISGVAHALSTVGFISGVAQALNRGLPNGDLGGELSTSTGSADPTVGNVPAEVNTWLRGGSKDVSRIGSGDGAWALSRSKLGGGIATAAVML